MRLALPGQANGRSYGALIERIRVLAADTLPADATVAVVSKGDEELLKLPGRRGWHFPESAPGVYAGHHPAGAPAGRDTVAVAGGAVPRLLRR